VEHQFNVPVLSTGRLSLAEFLPDAFESIPRNGIDAAAKKFYDATRECDGTAAYDWLRHLVALGSDQIKAELKPLRAKWRALPEVTEIINRAHQQVISVMNRFALVASAERPRA
jgi:hypothetical protein